MQNKLRHKYSQNQTTQNFDKVRVKKCAEAFL